MSCFTVLLRRLAAAAVLAVSVVALLVTPAAAAPAGLTANQERVVLDLVDDACGDTWCEGDYAFDFRQFSCDAHRRSCMLRLRIARYADGPLAWHWRSGEVLGFVRFRDMVRTAPSGGQSLTPDFYTAVSAMINRIEATVPPNPHLTGRASF